MGALIERLARLVSPVGLLIGALLFLLPFCAASCNSPFGGSGDLLKASGVNLALGGDVTPDCTVINQAVSALGSSLGNSLGGSGTSTANQGSSCASSTSSSTSSSSIIGTGTSALTSNTLGPFSGSGSADKFHVDRQLWATAAVVLLLLGAALAVLRGRVRAPLVTLVALGAAASLVVLRLTLNSRFTDDLKRSAASAGASGNGLLGLGDPTSLFSLNWGIGWTLALALAGAVAILNLVALAVPGGTRDPALAGGAPYGYPPAPGYDAPGPPGYGGYPPPHAGYPAPPAEPPTWTPPGEPPAPPPQQQ